jgi:hypothetical protein
VEALHKGAFYTKHEFHVACCRAASSNNDRIVSNRVARRRATGFSLFVYIHKYLKTQILRRATEFERTTKIKAFQFKSYDRTMFGLNRP